MSRYEKYSEKFDKLVKQLTELKKGGGVIMEYLNGTYWCPIVEFSSRNKPNNMGLDLTLKVVTHDRTLEDKFQDAKVGLTIGEFTMLATVGEIERKKKKDKSYHYNVELSWT